MRSLLFIIFLLSSLTPVEAYKVYYYDNNGNRVYHTVTQEEAKMYKNAPRRAFVRQPRKNWEITPRMRARKLTSSQFTHRY